MKYKTGNIVEAEEQIIVHGCNSKGAMGSGVAAAVRSTWLGAYLAYKDFEKTYGLPLASYSTFVTPEKRFVINLITQKNFGSDGKRYVNYAAISNGLDRIIGDTFEAHMKSNKPIKDLKIALPRIGAGLGGGNWEIIEAILLDLEEIWNNEVEFVVYDLA